jgi:hypothetical protein
VVKVDITLDMVQEIMDQILFLVQLLQLEVGVAEVSLLTDQQLKVLDKAVALEEEGLMAHTILVVLLLHQGKVTLVAMVKMELLMVLAAAVVVLEPQVKVGYLAIQFKLGELVLQAALQVQAFITLVEVAQDGVLDMQVEPVV